MLSVIVRTKNAESVLLESLRPLISAAAEGIVLDVSFADVGSQDGTRVIADAAGADFVSLGDQLTQRALASAHRGDWLLLVDQATVLTSAGLMEAVGVIERHGRFGRSNRPSSACFRPEGEGPRSLNEMRRQAGILLGNTLASRAWIEQGVLVHRSELTGVKGPELDWAAESPSLKLPGLLRLRSFSRIADPVPPEKQQRASHSSKALPHAG